MSEDSFRIPDYLGHILEAIRRIEEYTEDLTEAAFLAHEQVQDAVIRNIEIMGEAARRIDRRYPDFASQHPEVPWGEMYVMRNRVRMAIFRLTRRSSGKPSGTICPNWPNRSQPC